MVTLSTSSVETKNSEVTTMETISTKQIGENLRARCIEELSDAVKKIADFS